MQKNLDEDVIAMAKANMPIPAIAGELGIDPAQIRRILRQAGVPYPKKDNSARDAAIVKDYQDLSIRVVQILEKHHISYTQLYQILAESEIPVRTETVRDARAATMDAAVQMYIDKVPLWRIKEDTGVSQPQLHSELHRRDIPLRRPRNHSPQEEQDE